MINNGRVTGKVTVVTGAALGIGKAWARMLAAEGAAVVNGFVEEQGDIDAGRKALDSLHPLGHVGEPDDIAYGALYLASDESKFVTGSEFVIDGGYTAR